MVELTAAHWVYAFFIIVILVTMALRKDTPLVCIVASFVLSWVVTGDLVKAVQAVFNSITVAFSELLGIVVIISLIVAMAKMLEETGLAEMMFQPDSADDVSPEIAFWVMGVRHHDRGLDHLALAGHRPGGRAAPAGRDQGRALPRSMRPWPSACSGTAAP